LALAVSDVPHGADMTGTSDGIVVQMDSADGDTYDSQDGSGESNGVLENGLPDELLSAELNDAALNDVALELEPTNTVVPAAAIAKQPAPLKSVPATTASAPQMASVSGASQGRGGSPGGRGYAHVRVFGVEGHGNKFVYVFDRSASMEGAPLAAAKRQLVESLGALASIHQFHIIFFNHRLQSFDISGGGKRIAFGSDRNKQLAANFVGGITADGGTDRFSALKAALVFRPDVIFFLTDADDPMSTSELSDIEVGSQKSGAAISVIEFGRQPAPPGENFLTELAHQTGGQYGYVNTTQLSPTVGR
jgi:hypothetical protein